LADANRSRLELVDTDLQNLTTEKGGGPRD